MNKVHKPLKHIYGNKKESKIKNFKINLDEYEAGSVEHSSDKTSSHQAETTEKISTNNKDVIIPLFIIRKFLVII